MRRAARLLQADLAAALGVSRGHLASIESGRNLPGRAAMQAIAAHFNVSLDWLCRGVGDIKPARPVNAREALLLDTYRRLSKEQAQAMLDHMLERARAFEATG